MGSKVIKFFKNSYSAKKESLRFHKYLVSGQKPWAKGYSEYKKKFLAKVTAETTKIVHLFDTFFGMPSADMTKDLHKEGDFSDAPLDEVKMYLKDCNNVRFYPGLFPATSDAVSNLQFCLVHIDVDIYKSVADCCEFFYPRMVKGGIMVFDDYGFLSCPGAKMAVDEFFANKPEYPCYLPMGESFVIKL